MVPSGCTAYVESVPLAKPFVLVALVVLAVSVWVMVGVPAVSRLQVRGMVAAPSAKVVCTAGATATGGIVSAMPAATAAGAVTPLTSSNAPDVLKPRVPVPTTVVVGTTAGGTTTGVGIKSAVG